jgi:hypothetical protein
MKVTFSSRLLDVEEGVNNILQSQKRFLSLSMKTHTFSTHSIYLEMVHHATRDLWVRYSMMNVRRFF